MNTHDLYDMADEVNWELIYAEECWYVYLDETTPYGRAMGHLVDGLRNASNILDDRLDEHWAAATPDIS